jgi:hypothetical protein
MKKVIFTCFVNFIGFMSIYAQAVYVDSNNGNDKNPGTQKDPFFSVSKAAEIIGSRDNKTYVMKINPGIYILDKNVPIATEKEMKDKRIVIEAAVLPDDSSWTPEKMPVIISITKKGEIPEANSFVAGFLVNDSHVTIRGIRFTGYVYPNTRYFPIARFNKSKTDLLVEQCLFAGDENASQIQVGVIAHGDEIKIKHCVFYKARNAVVYWEDAGSGSKTGNSFTNNIVYGATQCAVWTSWPDRDFVFENNVVTDCKHFWIKNAGNTTKYTIDHSVVVNNQFFHGVPNDTGVIAKKFEMNEHNIVKEGVIMLRFIENLDAPMPTDYLHVIPGTLGYNLRAGLFK